MLVAMFVLGVIVGFILQSTLMAKHIKGNLRIKSDGEESYLFVELNSTVDKLANHKVVTFKVNKEDWDALK